jgi:hypothetical protein
VSQQSGGREIAERFREVVSMKKLAMSVLALVLSVVPGFSDTLVLKTGEKITGYFEGGSERVIKFRASDGVVKDYDLLSIQQIQFGDAKAVVDHSADPKLVPGAQRVTRPTSSTAANTGWTIPTGSKIVIRMIDSINSEKNKVGDPFVAVLDESIIQDGIEVVPRGSDVRGRIANANGAGRISGSAELGLELTQIIVNGIPYSVTTSEYEEVGEGRGKQTAKRAALGAGLGAAIGAIAGGGKGAAIGAGVGGGGATAVQVLTKGEKLNIPSETKLEFTLRVPLVVAAR